MVIIVPFCLDSQLFSKSSHSIIINWYEFYLFLFKLWNFTIQMYFYSMKSFHMSSFEFSKRWWFVHLVSSIVPVSSLFINIDVDLLIWWLWLLLNLIEFEHLIDLFWECLMWSRKCFWYFCKQFSSVNSWKLFYTQYFGPWFFSKFQIDCIVQR